MPGLNGAQVATVLHENAPGRVPPIILLTSRGDLGDFTGVTVQLQMTKPVKPSELQSALAQVLGTGGATRERTKIASPIDHHFASRYPLRILVAEDNPVNCKVIVTILERLGYRADAVANGREVLQRLARQPSELVLMDVQMPELDGLEATRRLRARVSIEDPPYVLALTANATKEDYHACIHAGMNDYLSKPVRTDDLMAALARAHAWLQTGMRASRAVARPELEMPDGLQA
jgi:CheY-like chemotaxis protein